MYSCHLIIINILTSNAIAKLSPTAIFDSSSLTLHNWGMRYLPSCELYIGKYNIFTEDEMNYYPKQELPKEKLSFAELLTVFPGNKGCLKKKLNEEIARCREDLEGAEEIRMTTDRIIESTSRPQNEEFWKTMAYHCLIKPLEEGREKMIKANSFKLNCLKKNGNEERTGDIGQFSLKEFALNIF